MKKLKLSVETGQVQTDMRRLRADCSWSVAVEDHDIQWENAMEAYDPTQ